MLPEIALTSQFMDRFAGRFGCPPVEWHSALSAAERARAWRAAATGEARVVVGARSALFLPFSGSRPDRRRRGARRRASSRRTACTTRRATWPWCAASLGKFPGRARLGDAVDREPRQRAHRPLSPRRAAGALFRRRAARRRQPIDMRTTPPERGKWLSPPLVEAVDRDAGSAGSSRCCSSIGAAMRR